MSDVSQAALLVAFPVAAAAGGAGVASWRPPGPRLTSAIQHFAAGVVLAALVGEVLPDLRSEGRWVWATAGFAAGVTLVLTLAAQGRRVDEKARERSRRLPLGLFAAVGIDLLLDGLLVGLGVRLLLGGLGLGVGARGGRRIGLRLLGRLALLALGVVAHLVTSKGWGCWAACGCSAPL